MEAKEIEMAEIRTALASEGAAPIELHPKAAEVYRRKVADLKAYLAAADDDARADAFRIIRELVEKIVVRAGKPYAPSTSIFTVA